MQDDVRPRRPRQPATNTQTPPETNTAQSEVSFETPEQIATQTELDHDYVAQVIPAKPRGSGHHWFNLPWPPTKAEIIAVTALLIVALAGGSVLTLRHSGAEVAQPAVKQLRRAAPKATAATTVPSTLTGLPVASSANQRPVVGVMVENSAAARPQAGLSQAGVVFEAVAEGGITRFLALYQDQQPANVGPIRSARPYYVQWALGFQAAYVHVGGSPDALKAISNWSVQDINQFYNSGVFRRLSSRPSPHNMYASVVDLSSAAVKKGFSSSFTGFARKTAAPAKAPTATSIDLNLSSSLYNPHYSYDAKTNSYLRAEGGRAQTDSNTATQLSPSVVIAMVVPVSSGSLDAQKSAYSNYNPIGSGSAYVFQDGIVTVGTWRKTSNAAALQFTDAAGAPLKLNPGQTWISAVAAGAKVSYH